MGWFALHQNPSHLAAATNEPPPIGSARMAEDGTLWLKLRAESGIGAIGDALIPYPTNHPEYPNILRHIGGIKPGQEKPVPPWPDEEHSPEKVPSSRPDPDDGFARAREVSVNQKIEVRFTPRQQQDWVKLHFERRGTLRVVNDWEAMRKSKLPFIPAATVFEPDRKEIGRLDPTPRLEPGAGYLNVSPGTLYVMVQNQIQPVAIAGSAAITFEFTPEDDPTEPNDDFEQATEISHDATIQFSLHPPGDKDFFKMKIPRPGHLSVTVGKGEIMLLDPMATVYDGAQREIARLHPLHEFAPSDQSGVRVQAGTLYVMISARNPPAFFPKGTPTTARFRFTPDDDPMEPNDSFALAREAKPGSILKVILWPPGDRDYFRIPVGKAASLYVTPARPTDGPIDRLETLVPGPGIRMRLYDDKQNPIGEARPELVARVTPPAAYLEIELPKAWGPTQGQQQPSNLTLGLELVEDEDSTEPNDDAEHAVAARFGTPTDVVFGSPADHDFFRLEAPSPGIIQAVTIDDLGQERQEPADLGGITFYDGENQKLRQSISRDRQVRAGPGPVFADIRAPQPRRDGHRGGIRRRVLFSFHPETDPTEPANDTRDGARSIRLGEPFSFRIAPDFDTDWFAFRLEAADQLRWMVSGPTDGRRLSIELHDGNGQAIGNLGERPLVVSESGPYALRIRSADLRGGTPVALTGLLATDRSWRKIDNTSPERANDLALNQVVILPASPGEKTYYFLLHLRTARHTALRTTWPEGSGELRTSLGGTLPLQPNAIIRLAAGNHLLAVTMKGQGVVSLRMENMEHHLPPELQYLLNRGRAAQAAETQAAPPPPPRLVTRDWIFDVRRDHEAP